MFTYRLYFQENGKTMEASSAQSHFPPESDQGREMVLNKYKLANKAEFKTPCAVAVSDKVGARTWFNRHGQPVEEEKAFQGA